jgi:hypothetical protein
MNQENNAVEFDTRQCTAKQRTADMADCLSAVDIFVFCPYAIFLRVDRFCFHPKRDEIIARSEKPNIDLNSD